MKRIGEKQHGERGNILLVVVFLATAIAGLAAISSGRVVSESRLQTALEHETRSYNSAYAQLHLAMNVVNTAAYDDDNHNRALRDAMTGLYGGTAANATTPPAGTTQPTGKGRKGGTAGTTTEPAPVYGDGSWLDDPEGVLHGMIEGTDVRVYHGRDYIMRLQKLKGEPVAAVDPFGDSDRYFVLEAIGRSSEVVRLVSALVRETQPFSSYVFFQNEHTLGISGKPLGLIHTNDTLAFYFPNGRYVDTVSAVNGFEYRSGATPDNTFTSDANPQATPISLEEVNFDELRAKANVYVGEPGLDAEILFFNKGQVRIKPYTPPRWDVVELKRTKKVLTGYTTETSTVMRSVQVGTQQVERTRQVIDHYDTEVYTVTEPIYEMQTETYTVTIPVYEDQQVTKTRQVPIYAERTVTRTRWVKVFVPYDTGGDAGSGTTVGDSGGGVLGEYQWVQEEYETTETYVADYRTEQYTVTESVQTGTTTETRTRQVQVQTGTQTVERTRQVPVYRTETYYEDVPVYEEQPVEVTSQVPVYENVSYTVEEWHYQPPVPLGQKLYWANDTAGTIFVDGRIISMEGDLNGRLTVVSTDKVRITGDIRYIDDSGETAMLNGTTPSQTYSRNIDYEGRSVLGVIAKEDVVFTWSMADNAEINATLMSVDGRVGMDGIWLDANGEPYLDNRWARRKLLTKEELTIEDLYDRSGTFRTRPFVKNSLRRIGGLISNHRIMETYIRSRSDGTAYVAAGFKRGAMRFDFNLLHNPPPNFVEVPRPVLSYFAPIFLVRNNEDK
ncbi:MAG: hypothetical protein ACYTEZ_08395 [Planctomycetota bacterium]|jgi:hypothetical protein